MSARSAIYYFSATGNSLVVAQDLARELGNAEVIPVTQALKASGESVYDLIGIVYPVYMFGLPLIIADFLKKVPVKPGAYVFGVATLGGLPGRAHSLSQHILASRGIKLAAGFSVLMPGNYTPLYGAVNAESQNKMFVAEKQKASQIAEYVKQQKRGLLEEKPFLINWLLYVLLYRGGSKQIPKAAKGFWANQSCTKCGLCAKVCPVANIELKEGKPVWLSHCQHCMACLQWCPVEAIQFNKSTSGRQRYHHPEIKAVQIMQQQ